MRGRGATRARRERGTVRASREPGEGLTRCGAGCGRSRRWSAHYWMTRMDAFKRYLLGNFEQVFVLLVLVSTAIINFYIPQKLAFLNFYFLPVILGAYYLGRRMAVLGAFMCLLMVVIYLLIEPEAFAMEASQVNTYVH